LATEIIPYENQNELATLARDTTVAGSFYLLKVESQNVCVTLVTVGIITAKLAKTTAFRPPGIPLAAGPARLKAAKFRHLPGSPF